MTTLAAYVHIADARIPYKGVRLGEHPGILAADVSETIASITHLTTWFVRYVASSGYSFSEHEAVAARYAGPVRQLRLSTLGLVSQFMDTYGKRVKPWIARRPSGR
jgi:hypothetical protein